jgi:hypothetical protein
VVLVCQHVPEIAMWGRGQDRQKAIARELPDVLRVQAAEMRVRRRLRGLAVMGLGAVLG